MESYDDAMKHEDAEQSHLVAAEVADDAARELDMLALFISKLSLEEKLKLSVWVKAKTAGKEPRYTMSFAKFCERGIEIMGADSEHYFTAEVEMRSSVYDGKRTAAVIVWKLWDGRRGKWFEAERPEDALSQMTEYAGPTTPAEVDVGF